MQLRMKSIWELEPWIAYKSRCLTRILFAEHTIAVSSGSHQQTDKMSIQVPQLSEHFLPHYSILAWLPFLAIFLPIIKTLGSYLYDAKGFRKYPTQNIFSGVTDFAYLWEIRKDVRSKRLHEAHEGKPIIRIGPNSLSFGDSKAVKDIYGYTTSCTKGDIYAAVSKGGHSNLIDTVNKAVHSGKRRILANAYAAKNIEKWEPRLAEETLKLLEQFDKRCVKSGETTEAQEHLYDFKKWIHLLTLDSIAAIGLSSSTNFVETGNDIFVIDSDGIEKSIRIIDSQYGGLRAACLTIFATEWFHTLKKLTPYASQWYKEAWEHGANWGKFIKEIVRYRIERYRKGEQIDDFITSLLEDRHGVERNLDVGEIEAETSAMSKSRCINPRCRTLMRTSERW